MRDVNASQEGFSRVKHRVLFEARPSFETAWKRFRKPWPRFPALPPSFEGSIRADRERGRMNIDAAEVGILEGGGKKIGEKYETHSERDFSFVRRKESRESEFSDFSFFFFFSFEGKEDGVRSIDFYHAKNLSWRTIDYWINQIKSAMHRYIYVYLLKNQEISHRLVGKKERVIIKRYSSMFITAKGILFQARKTRKNVTRRVVTFSENYANSCNKGCHKLSAHLGLAVTASN